MVDSREKKFEKNWTLRESRSKKTIFSNIIFLIKKDLIVLRILNEFECFVYFQIFIWPTFFCLLLFWLVAEKFLIFTEEFGFEDRLTFVFSSVPTKETFFVFFLFFLIFFWFKFKIFFGLFERSWLQNPSDYSKSFSFSNQRSLIYTKYFSFKAILASFFYKH